MAEPVPPQKKPLVSVEFQTEINVATGAAERRMFLKMYFDARDSGLLASLGDRRWTTLCVLATYMDENGHCYPSQDRIARDLGIRRQRVNERIQELLAFRFHGEPVIALQPGPRVGGRWANNRYRIYPVSGLQMFGKPSPSATEPTVSGFPDTATVSGSTDTVNPDTNQNQIINQKVVNALPSNDHKTLPGKKEKLAPRISDRALRATYGLSNEQTGQVHYLVEKQITVLGAGVRNHAHYVKRAAEAVAAGDGNLLDVTLSDYKQAAATKKDPVANPPAFFTSMWNEARQRRASVAVNPEPARQSTSTDLTPLRGSLASAMRPPAADPDTRIERIIDNATARGFTVPENIRRSSHYPTVARWWAALEDEPSIKERRSSAP